MHPRSSPRAPIQQTPLKRLPASDKPVGSTPHSGAPAKIPSEWTRHYNALLHLRDRLTRAHAEHATEAATPAEMRGVDVADTTQEQLDRHVLWAELGAEDDKLFEVDCALQRLREGVYGFCEKTGNPIPPERLRAVPWTRYCRIAAAQHEQDDAKPSKGRV